MVHEEKERKILTITIITSNNTNEEYMARIHWKVSVNNSAICDNMLKCVYMLFVIGYSIHVLLIFLLNPPIQRKY